MSNPRRFQLDEIMLRPGTYFNPQTEIMIVVDDSPEVDHEIFESGDFDGEEWVLIAEEAPLDEPKRDELVERFQLSHGAGGELRPRTTRSTTMKTRKRTSSRASRSSASKRSDLAAPALASARCIAPSV